MAALYKITIWGMAVMCKGTICGCLQCVKVLFLNGCSVKVQFVNGCIVEK